MSTRRPDPRRVRTPADLVDALTVLRTWAGEPSLRTLTRLAGRTGTGSRALPLSTLSDNLAPGRRPRLPSRSFVTAYVRACLRAAGLDEDAVADEVRRWQRAWQTLNSRHGAAPAAATAVAETEGPAQPAGPGRLRRALAAGSVRARAALAAPARAGRFATTGSVRAGHTVAGGTARAGRALAAGSVRAGRVVVAGPARAGRAVGGGSARVGRALAGGTRRVLGGSWIRGGGRAEVASRGRHGRRERATAGAAAARSRAGRHGAARHGLRGRRVVLVGLTGMAALAMVVTALGIRPPGGGPLVIATGRNTNSPGATRASAASVAPETSGQAGTSGPSGPAVPTTSAGPGQAPSGKPSVGGPAARKPPAGAPPAGKAPAGQAPAGGRAAAPPDGGQASDGSGLTDVPQKVVGQLQEAAGHAVSAVTGDGQPADESKQQSSTPASKPATKPASKPTSGGQSQPAEPANGGTPAEPANGGASDQGSARQPETDQPGNDGVPSALTPPAWQPAATEPVNQPVPTVPGGTQAGAGQNQWLAQQQQFYAQAIAAQQQRYGAALTGVTG